MIRASEALRPGLVFGADSESLFYVRNDPITLRASQVWRHRVGGVAK